MKLDDVIKKEGLEKPKKKSSASPVRSNRKRERPWSADYSGSETTIGHKNTEPNVSQNRAKSILNTEPNVSQSEKEFLNTEPNVSQNRANTTLNTTLATEPNVSQNRANCEPNDSYFSLIGLQRKILDSLFDSCLIAGSKISQPLNSEIFAKSVESTVAAVRKAIQRLVAKGLIARSIYKKGPGGWTRYELGNSIYSELLMIKNRANTEPNVSQNRANTTLNTTLNCEPIPPSSSRDLIIKETTTEKAAGLKIDDQIEISSVLSFGISKTTIARAVQLNPNLELEDIQNLIFRFGVYASDPKNKMQSAVGFFLGLCKQLGQGMIPLEHIQTPDEKLLSDLAKQSKAAAVQKQETEDALLAFEFEAWMDSISIEKRNELVPESVAVRPGSHAQTMMLKKYYIENLWDLRRKEILRTARDLTRTI